MDTTYIIVLGSPVYIVLYAYICALTVANAKWNRGGKTASVGRSGFRRHLEENVMEQDFFQYILSVQPTTILGGYKIIRWKVQ